MSLTAETLAEEIKRLAHSDPLSSELIACDLLPFIERHIAAGQQGATNPAAESIQYHSAVGPIDAMAAAFSAMDNSDTALEEWPQRAIDALAFAGWAVVPYALPYEVLGEAGISGVFETGNPKHGWDWLVAKTRIGPHGPPAATPQPPKDANGDIVREAIAILRDMPTDRIEYNEELSALIRKLKPASPKPAGAVPLPVMEVLDRREVTPVCDHVVMGYTQAQLVEYGDAREAAGRAGAVPAHRVADLLHLLQFATITTPTHGDDEQAKKVMAELSDLLAAPIPQQPAAEPAAVNQSLTTEGAEAVYQYQTVTNGWHDLLDAADSEKYKAAGWPVRTLYTRPTPAADAGGVTDDDLAELNRLRALVNSPELHDFARGTVLEAAHQVERWGTEHDNGKTPADWFWLVGYLAGKALHAHTSGNTEKALHHTISTAGALANWHRAINGANDMRPGIDGAAALTPEVRHA